MFDAGKHIQEIQKWISEHDQFEWNSDDPERLLFTEVQGLFHLEFYGFPWNDNFLKFIELICIPEVASKIVALNFRSPDQGANGTLNWDFSELIQSKTDLANLKTLFVEPYQPEWHNFPIIAESLEEEGMIAKLIAKMPCLKKLTLPNSPDASFFEVSRESLSYLRVESGYDPQNFIFNLSHSSCFPNLQTLDFGDYNQQYVDEYPEACIPFEHYVELFCSRAFASIQLFVLRNAVLSPTQLQELHQQRQGMTFRFIQSYGDYV